MSAITGCGFSGALCQSVSAAADPNAALTLCTLGSSRTPPGRGVGC